MKTPRNPQDYGYVIFHNIHSAMQAGGGKGLG